MTEAKICLIRTQAKNINKKAKQLETLAGIESHYSGFGSNNVTEKTGAKDAQKVLLMELRADLMSFDTEIKATLADMIEAKKESEDGIR